MQRAPGTRDAMRILIHRQIGVIQHAFGSHAAGAAQQGTDTRNHMFDGEGFGDVIIRADIQRAYCILIFRACGDHDDGQIARLSAAAQLPANFDAGKRWQHPIQQHDIRPRFRYA